MKHFHKVSALTGVICALISVVCLAGCQAGSSLEVQLSNQTGSDLRLIINQQLTDETIAVGDTLAVDLAPDETGNYLVAAVDPDGMPVFVKQYGKEELEQMGNIDIKQWPEPPEMSIDTTKKYTAVIETDQGDLTLELFAADVSVTVNNFVFLAREGFYDNITFHRVIADFMAQGGDPTGTGMGGPGYRFNDEFTDHTHVAGTLSMANSGANTNGSQFFICYEPQPHLNRAHTVFGQLTEGMDVLKKLSNGSKIKTIRIIEE